MNMYVKDTTCKLLNHTFPKKCRGGVGGYSKVIMGVGGALKSNLGGGGHSKVILGVGGTQK